MLQQENKMEGFLLPTDSIYKDILDLLEQQSKTTTATTHYNILTELIIEEVKLVRMITEGNVILARDELSTIKKNTIKATSVTNIK